MVLFVGELKAYKHSLFLKKKKKFMLLNGYFFKH